MPRVESVLCPQPKHQPSTDLSSNDGEAHAVVGLVKLNHVDLGLASRDRQRTVAHHARASRLFGK